MSKKEQLVGCLNLYGESYYVNENKIIINSAKPLIIIVEFSSDKIIISAELRGWNFLTGLIEMTFEKVINYLSKMILLMGFIFLFLFTLFFFKEKGIDNNTLLVSNIIILILINWTSLIYINFRIRYENLKDESPPKRQFSKIC